jgi:hypothetical protein
MAIEISKKSKVIVVSILSLHFCCSLSDFFSTTNSYDKSADKYNYILSDTNYKYTVKPPIIVLSKSNFKPTIIGNKWKYYCYQTPYMPDGPTTGLSWYTTLTLKDTSDSSYFFSSETSNAEPQIKNFQILKTAQFSISNIILDNPLPFCNISDSLSKTFRLDNGSGARFINIAFSANYTNYTIILDTDFGLIYQYYFTRDYSQSTHSALLVEFNGTPLPLNTLLHEINSKNAYNKSNPNDTVIQ